MALNKLIRSVCVFLVVYALLAMPWPGVQACYSAVYRGVCNTVFGRFGADGLVRFDRKVTDGKRSDTTITIARIGSKEGLVIPHKPRLTGYLPTVELIALILATPLPWPRRWRALAWGLVWVNAFVLARVCITLAHVFDGDNPWSLYSLSEFWSDVLYGAYELLASSGATSFLIPIFIWLIVTFRRSDWETFASRAVKP